MLSNHFDNFNLQFWILIWYIIHYISPYVYKNRKNFKFPKNYIIEGLFIFRRIQ